MQGVWIIALRFQSLPLLSETLGDPLGKPDDDDRALVVRLAVTAFP